MNHKQKFQYIAKISLVSLLIVVGIETILKLSFDCQLSGVKYDKVLGWRFKENYRGTIIKILDNGEQLRTRITFNNRGFRDRDHHVNKAEDVKRIIILGDSYTAGTAVSDDEIFANIFEKKLNDNHNKSYKYEVMNVAVAAWSTDQHLIYLKHEGLLYKPDYIILMIAPNDIREAFGKGFFNIDNENKLARNKPSPLPLKTRFLWYLSGRFCTFQAVQYMLGTNYGSFRNISTYFPSAFHTGNEIFTDTHLFLKKESPELAGAKKLFLKILSEIHAITQNNNIKLILSVIPTKIEFDSTLENEKYDPRKIAAFISTAAKHKNIPYMDLNSIVRNQEDPLTNYISWEYHFNKKGHMLVANELLRIFKNIE